METNNAVSRVAFATENYQKLPKVLKNKDKFVNFWDRPQMLPALLLIWAVSSVTTIVKYQTEN